MRSSGEGKVSRASAYFSLLYIPIVGRLESFETILRGAMCFLLVRAFSGRVSTGDVIGLPICSGGEKMLLSWEGIELLKWFELASKTD